MGKDKKSKAKEAFKKESPQSTRNVTVKGKDAAYTAVVGQGSDTEDIAVAPRGSGSHLPPQSSKKKGKKNKKSKRKDNDSDDDDSSTELIRKPSPVVAPLPQLSKEEYEFFEMVKTGDVDDVAAFLSSDGFKDMNINKTDKTGYTVLHFAIRRQDQEMVKLLVKQPGIRIYDTLLHAIRERNVEITKILLELYDMAMNTETKERLSLISASITASVSPISGRSGVISSVNLNNQIRLYTAPFHPSSSPHLDEDDEDDDMPFDSEFPSVITPLMLAAQEKCYPLMELFYERNERLEFPYFPHNVGCECDICVKLEGDQDMTRAYQRYHLFKALTQPEYICFIARKEKLDPVNYAISKIVKVREIIERDKAYNNLFEGYETRLEEFMSKMLQLCRNTAETEIFMSPKDTDERERLPHLYPRLWYTVGLDLKHFVTQPNAQNMVYKMWATDDWPDWDTYGWIYRSFNIAIRIVAFPLIAIFLLVGQDTGIGRTLATPVSRFLTYIGSYIFFLCLCGFQVMFPYQRCNDQEPYYQIDDDHCKQRGAPNIGTEWPIIIYVLSFYVSMMKRQSVGWYWKMRWNWFELISQITFTVTFLCWAWAWIWTKMPENQELLMATDRLMWPHDCAEIFGECFLAISFMLAGGRVLRFFTVLPDLGPIQIALGKQVVDFLSTMLIMSVVIFAFSSGMMALFMPYKDFHGLDPLDHKREKAMDDAFHSTTNAFKTLFFMLYEHGGPEVAKMLIWNVKNETGHTEEIFHQYTAWTARFLFLSYNVIGITMLFSMLSGYFAQTFEEVMEDVDLEWKYARTELYLTFIKDTVLPPPFNLIPTVKGMVQGAKFMGLLGKKEDPRADCSFRQCCYVTSNKKTEKWRKLMRGYRKLILQLIYRYKNQVEEEKGEEEATKDDVLELAEELAEIKALLKKSTKGGDNVKSEGDDDDDDFPFGGGTIASAASSKKGWSKTKYIVESGGSTYLKNVNSAGGGGDGDGGGTGGAASNLSNRSGDGGGGGGGGTGKAPSSMSNRSSGGTSSQMNANSVPSINVQPSGSGTSSRPGPPSAATSATLPGSKGTSGHSDKISMLFMAQQSVPKRSSALIDFTDFGGMEMDEGNNNNTSVYGPQVSDKCTACYQQTPPIKATWDPRRSEGGIERPVGLEDFSGLGNVERAYQSQHKSGNYLDINPFQSRQPGLLDHTGSRPNNNESRHSSGQFSQKTGIPNSGTFHKSPKQEFPYVTPKRGSGIIDVWPTDTTRTGLPSYDTNLNKATYRRPSDFS